jgi:hypothetical protein
MVMKVLPFKLDAHFTPNCGRAPRRGHASRKRISTALTPATHDVSTTNARVALVALAERAFR